MAQLQIKKNTMTTKDFKEMWPNIEGRIVKVCYGKSTFHNLILIRYNEAIATAETSMKGSLNIRSIKSIDIVEPIEVKSHVIEVPKPQVGLLKDGYFVIVGQLAGHWKHVELKDRLHLTKRVSQTFLDHNSILDWIGYVKKEEKGAPDVLVDETFCIPEYYHLKPAIGGRWVKEKIEG